jgi:hypothetical protein
VKGNPTGVVNGEFHGLKIQIPNDKVALAFSSSNAADVALGIIAAVSQKLQSHPQTDVCSNVFDNYQQRLNSSGSEKSDCEFLVLQLDTKGNRLAHITAGGIKPCERAYIGDPNQYKQMSALRKPYEPPAEKYVQRPDGTFKIEKTNDSKGQIEFMEVSLALEELVQRRNREVGAIGDNVIRVCDARPSGNLEYLQVGMASSTPEEGAIGLFSSVLGHGDARNWIIL